MKMVKQEFINIFKNKILLISVIAITFIPILYASVFDKSVWDPYGMAKDLPVAIVNEDQPTEMLGQKIDVGNQVVDQLKGNKDLKWEFVSADKAKKGMDDLYYYMIVTIPKDFSKSATTLLDKNPEKMEITYTTNGSLNYIGQEIVKIGATTLESQVRDNVTGAYVTALNQVGKKAVAGINEASNGASQLANGTDQLQSGLKEYTSGVSQASDGSNQLTAGMGSLAGNIGPLSSGVTQLYGGASELSSGLGLIDQKVQPLGGKINQLSSGLDELSQGSKELETALATIESSLNETSQTTIKNNLLQAQADLEALLANTNKLNSVSLDASKISADLEAVSTSLNTIATTLHADSTALQASIADSINQLKDVDEAVKSTLINDINQAVINFENEQNQKVADVTGQLSSDLASAQSSAEALAVQAATLGELTSGIAENAGSLQNGINEIGSGTQQIMGIMDLSPSGNAGSLVAGLEQINSNVAQLGQELPTALNGVTSLASGSDQLASGLNDMYSKMPELSSGVSQLDSGATQLNSGLAELSKNSPELLKGISQLDGGSNQLATALGDASKMGDKVKLEEKNIDMFADPTSLKNDEYSQVDNYGQALAPYIMSLALFVGCLVFNFVFPIRRVSMLGQSSKDWWLSKVAIGFVVSTAMAAIEATVMLLIGLKVEYVGKFYLMAFVTVWAYMFMIMFFAMTFDNPGRFIMMILLVLQLGGAGGTFPLPLQNSFFNAIHPYLPMSYSVYGFREAISSGIGAPLFNKSVMILLSVFVAFVVLLGVSMNILQKRHLSNVSELDDNQKMQALEK
ncbi:YhgE/Pip domain-containing protein [Vagococcus penaei]|uniref:YhgE/Pip domain-containing protein n=1 Tax=Vagococcus penaei TaxID=633807 RepID=A0A1Q2D5B6_9ENTE|nr:YhgE/Pip domain-containing protein [Vagococcus penaei]AQP53475.1 YhgE/Pip domain-containing protein [Vagococcus penaei]RSU00865.1 YhgE/Pip domain-containing protein [Vagococcus penaei]